MEIKLRPMTMDDAEKMLEWKNYSETRKFAIATHKKIKLKDHMKWLKKNIKSFQIINENMGAVRVYGNEAAIWVDRKYRGKGIATKVFKMVTKKGMIGHVVCGNIASMRMLIRVGFEPIEYHKNYYLFIKQ